MLNSTGVDSNRDNDSNNTKNREDVEFQVTNSSTTVINGNNSNFNSNDDSNNDNIDYSTLKEENKENLKASSHDNSEKDVSKLMSSPKLISFTEGTPEFAVQTALQKLMFDPNTSEGNTRKLL